MSLRLGLLFDPAALWAGVLCLGVTIAAISIREVLPVPFVGQVAVDLHDTIVAIALMRVVG